MIKIKIIFISLIFLLANCGFSRIYVKNINNNFSIENVIYNGDKELNNFLKTDLKKWVETTRKNIIDICYSNNSYLDIIEGGYEIRVIEETHPVD